MLDEIASGRLILHQTYRAMKIYTEFSQYSNNVSEKKKIYIQQKGLYFIPCN